MEDKNLENLFAQLDAEAKTEAGTDPGAKSAGLTPEEIEMWDAVFIEELNRAIEDQEQGEDNGIIEQADRTCRLLLNILRYKLKITSKNYRIHKTLIFGQSFGTSCLSLFMSLFALLGFNRLGGRSGTYTLR
jgi:hypothetical protein